MKMLPLAAALLLSVAAPALAQEGQNLSDTNPQNDTPVSDQHSGPTGDRLAKPADPTKKAQGPTQPAVDSGSTAAVGSRPRTDDAEAMDDSIRGTSTTKDAADADDGNEGGEGARQRPGGGQQGSATQPDSVGMRTDRAEQSGTIGNASDKEAPGAGGAAAEKPAQSYRDSLGPNAGGATGKGAVYLEELKDYTVHLKDKQQFGKVARVIVDLETGKLQSMEVSTGGLLGVGDTRFAVPWEKVEGVNTGTKELRVSASSAELKPQDEAFAERR